MVGNAAPSVGGFVRYGPGLPLDAFSYDPATGLLSRQTERGLDYHNHRVTIVATDAQGLVTTREWNFSLRKR